eukprot:13595841-Alexandrium_andersonii.AAC.1
MLSSPGGRWLPEHPSWRLQFAGGPNRGGAGWRNQPGEAASEERPPVNFSPSVGLSRSPAPWGTCRRPDHPTPRQGAPATPRPGA